MNISTAPGSANSVIAAIDARRPGLKLAKKYSLRFFVQSSQPWQAATKPGGGGVIDLDVLRDWSRRDDETNDPDPDDERPNRAERAAADEIWKKHMAESA